jgi:hypothetical protein
MHTPRDPVIASLPAGADPADRARADSQAARLWDMLARARAHYDPRVLATAEDAVFGFYLSLARTMARGQVAGAGQDVDTERAAEFGLAEAVLRWRRNDGRGFEAHARVVIAAQLRRASTVAGPRQRRRPADRPAPGMLVATG